MRSAANTTLSFLSPASPAAAGLRNCFRGAAAVSFGAALAQWME